MGGDFSASLVGCRFDSFVALGFVTFELLGLEGGEEKALANVEASFYGALVEWRLQVAVYFWLDLLLFGHYR